MKRMSATVCVTLIAVFAIAGSTTSQSPKPTKLESELRSVLHARWAALARNDAEAYGAFLDDDVLIPDNGLLYDKKSLIEHAHTLNQPLIHQSLTYASLLRARCPLGLG